MYSLMLTMGLVVMVLNVIIIGSTWSSAKGERKPGYVVEFKKKEINNIQRDEGKDWDKVNISFEDTN
jgi:hypothetical protein